ncbi:PepSY domain-containing protein [Porphyromonas macacae]|uniref:PepSY domain-containing protein n=1 Tax=Porphyromonas macacae TaxID=28115 RepID=UPI0024AD0A6F|nr:PepSY domain-containing protein [Porphyromonas macacae]
MRKSTNVLVRALLTLLWVYSLSSCGIWGSGSYKNVSCDFDYSIREEDKTLDLSKYQLGKSYENDSSIVKVLLIYEETNEHTKYVYMKKTGMRKIISYDSTGRISDAYFKYSEAHIGPRYDFDEHGNITDSIDTDTGYTICWAQAMAIGKAHAGHKMHKTEPNLILDKGNEGTYEWHFLYDDKKKRTKELVIDAKTGKVIKEYKVRVIV